MKEERKRILKMLSEGKIDETQAEELLDALSCNNNDTSDNDTSDFEVTDKNAEKSNNDFEQKYSLFKNDVVRNHSNMLLIFVSSAEGENVKIKFPMSFIKLMIKAAGNDKININGINIDKEALESAIENDLKGRIVDVDSNDGDNVIIEII